MTLPGTARPPSFPRSTWLPARSGPAYRRRRRVEFLDFMNKIVADQPDRDIHVVLDNLNAQAKRDGWLPRHGNVRFRSRRPTPPG